MANLLTRRLALFRIASVAGATAVAVPPVALAAVQPRTPEKPELLALGGCLIAKADECARLRQIKADARARVMKEWPALPPEIRVERYRGLLGTRNETDCDDEAINRGGPYQLSIYEHYHGTQQINERLAEVPERAGTASEKRERQALKRMLPVAGRYEGAKAAAMAAHDYRAKVEAYDQAEWEVTQALYQIAAMPALTPDGITIKAQAYRACSMLGKEQRLQATIHLGPSIAEDVCRVLSEGDEA
jgi:hypothetical protein